MEERALRVLEFFPFLATLKNHAATEVGRSMCLALLPCTGRNDIQSRLEEVVEAIRILQEEGDLPAQGTLEVRPLLLRARAEGACLHPEDFLSVRSTLEAASRVKHFLKRVVFRPPLLENLGERLPSFPHLRHRLQSALGPRGEILDSASPELLRLRREIQQVRTRIRSSLEGLLGQETLRKIYQESIITLRKDRYVLAVKAEYKQRLPGIIHDQSQSRATFFIEPLATVEENNELNLLQQDEKEEEHRILLDLTAAIREEGGAIAQAVALLGQLDLIFAKAKYGQAIRGTIPCLSEEGIWDLRNARHPLLDPQSTVPVCLRFEKGQSTLILTGANTGGKTVSLKTLGLLTLMAQCGVPIPADEGSRVAVVKRIFADIGDEQSLQDNLSTFSAWIRTTSRIVQEADSASLVLLDEVGGGTDPAEGAALTMALLDKLRSLGAKTVVTTHLHLLKAYGAIHPDIVNVSVEFNPDTLRPTYRLIYGRPGESYALLMAEKYGLPHDLIEEAQKYLGEGDRKVGELLGQLERFRHDLEKETREVERLRQEAGMDREKTRLLLLKAQGETAKHMGEAREEARRFLTEAREEIRGLIQDFRTRGRTDLHRLGEMIREKEEEVERFVSREAGKPGNGKSFRGSGVGLKSLKGLFSAQTLPNPSGEKSKSGGKREKAPPPKVQYEVPAAAPVLKIIGLRVEEALPLLDKALDEAFLGGLRELEVIHGAGTGRLRQAVREHLRDHALVKTFSPGNPGRGGNGVTVVEVGPSARKLHSQNKA